MAYRQRDARHDVYNTQWTLEVGNDIVPEYRKQSFAQRHFGGTKRTLRAFAITGVIVLSINVGWLAYAKSKYGIQDGYGIIETEDCSSVKKLNTGFHFLINVLSTLLLTGSNAFMAAYSGPTRQEIDKAHAKRKWLHIGAMSFRNLLHISWTKSLVVIVLALSSVPFHLLYNSLIFTELSANEYYWAITTEGFLTGDSFNLTGPIGKNPNYYDGPDFFWVYASQPDGTDFSIDQAYLTNPDDVAGLQAVYQAYGDIQRSAPTWERLDPEACLKAYASSFVSDRRHVVLVSSAKNDTTSILNYGSADLGIGSTTDNNWWICSLRFNDGGNLKCNARDYMSDPGAWEVYGYPVEYCLSERVSDVCSLKFSMEIMLVVVGFNALKVVAMLLILLRLDAQNLLACVGDAVTSFIRYPDQTTRGMCLADKRTIKTYWRMPFARVFDHTSSRWGAAISKTRWTMFMLVMLVSWFTVLIFGIWGFSSVKSAGVNLTPAGLWSLGFGTVDQHAMFQTALDSQYQNTVINSLVANVPQVVLAVIYLLYMGIMTALFNAVDWARFANSAQTLMVGTPCGTQRGTWLLGAPLAYGIGLLVMQTLLHWFVSQSLFIVQMNVFDKRGIMVPELNTPSIGFSPIAIIFSVVFSGVLVCTALFFTFRRLPAGAPPVVATCSAAISAACHVPAGLMSEAVVYEKLRWGVTDHATNGIGHCSLGPEKAFESGWAYAPMPGRAYAGMETTDGKT